jgi:hypothetical protein
MTNLIIGILVGVASAVVLMIMWLAAERVRQEISTPDDQAEAGGFSDGAIAHESRTDKTTDPTPRHWS